MDLGRIATYKIFKKNFYVAGTLIRSADLTSRTRASATILHECGPGENRTPVSAMRMQRVTTVLQALLRSCESYGEAKPSFVLSVAMPSFTLS